MIELDVKGYCHNCSDFEPHAERLYVDDTACHTIVTCKYAERCEHIENYIRGDKERIESSGVSLNSYRNQYM